MFNDFEHQECNDDDNDKIEKLQEFKNKEKEKELCPHHADDVEIHVLDKTIKFCVKEDKNDNEKELKAEFGTINNVCSNFINAPSCRFQEACNRLSTDIEDTDQSLHKSCAMGSDLKERCKQRETKWTQTVTDLMEKCKSLENNNDEQTDDESLNDNQDVNETKPNVVENMIENMPQSLLNGMMSDQTSSDESSRRSEWSPETYDSGCNSE